MTFGPPAVAKAGLLPHLAARAFIIAAAASASLVAGADGPSLERLRTFDLPEEVAAASDLRWYGDGVLLLGVAGNGVYSWRVRAEEASLMVTLAGSAAARFGRFQDYSRVGGASSGVLAFSSGSYGIYRHDASGTSASRKEMEIVGDLDRWGARTVAVGLSRGLDGEWEDRLAWLVAEDGTIRGILPRRTDESHWFLAAELGVSRFISEDRVLVVPGLEPGVFVYDWSGRLRDTFRAERFFADDPWKIDPEIEFLLPVPPFFEAWLSQHRVIDEIVADRAGNVFFFVRHVPSTISFPSEPRVDGQRVTGGITVISRSGGVEEQPLTSEQAAELLELARSRGGGTSGGPIRIAMEDLDRILEDPEMQGSSVPAKVCWDLVHARADGSGAVTKTDCVVDSEFADARLRADLRGDSTAILVRGNTYGAVTEVRPSEAFEALLLPPER